MLTRHARHAGRVYRTKLEVGVKKDSKIDIFFFHLETGKEEENEVNGEEYLCVL